VIEVYHYDSQDDRHVEGVDILKGREELAPGVEED